ncbi:MAG: gamma-glutamylcyclotransferase [Cohaesibacter sp.]|jgi:cation transport protein ChaC|nr:gamma-glutamylcyclotransferase [Cohaesibacter sp.]
MSDLWVFGYGSLMWRPGFDYEQSCIARLEGYHRSLCIYSHVYRGSPECPGLVLGLDDEGTAMGRAFRVKAENREPVIEYLREREQVTSVYVEHYGTLTLLDGSNRQVEAVTYIADQQHEQYAGKLSIEDQVRFVLQGKGIAGPNIDYVTNTVDHLKEISIEDPDLFALCDRLRGN